MESRKELLNKATDAYIHIFTGTRHQRKKHINDNEYLITKVESELRIINVGVITSLILMVTLMVLIVVIFVDSFTIRNFNTNTTTNPLAIFQTQKLYIIYTNGLVLDFQLTKNMQFQELESQKFPKDKGGHFGFYDIDKLFVFLGSENKLGYYLQDSLIRPIINGYYKIESIKGFTPDSTHVRVGNFFWLIGGSVHSSLSPISNEPIVANTNSMIWSLSKNKWLNGPDYIHGTSQMHVPIIFGYTCAVAINKTAVLFIGLQDYSKSAFDELAPNDIVIIYNFEFNIWTLQNFLPFNGSIPIKHIISAHVYNDTSCVVLHEKVRSRIIVISAIKYHRDGSNKEMYKKLAWVSDISLQMKWTMLKIIHPIRGINNPGKMVALQGVVFFISFPNSDGIFGYRISINEDTIQFLQLGKEGLVYECQLAQDVLNTSLVNTDRCIEPSKSTKMHQLNLVPHY